MSVTIDVPLGRRTAQNVGVADASSGLRDRRRRLKSTLLKKHWIATRPQFAQTLS
jgi:hypothetical protein